VTTSFRTGGVEGLEGFLLQVEITETIMHEACEPNAVSRTRMKRPPCGGLVYLPTSHFGKSAGVVAATTRKQIGAID
jgi:hypothetical protein